MAKLEVASTSSFCCLYSKENSNIFRYFVVVFNKTIISLTLIGYEMIIANSALRASLAIYHLISNARSWIKNIIILLNISGYSTTPFFFLI